MKSLAGRKALVTGGSRGIGAATALLLAEHGTHLAIGYRARVADAERVVRQARALGVEAHAVASDIATPEGAQRLVDDAARQLGGLDFFVGNSGIWIPEDAPVAGMADAQWRRTMRENVDSMFFTTRAAARVLNDHGRIVLVASTAGQRGEANHADYAASKGAMISFVKSVCIELAPRDIAGPIAFLCSDLARHITGEILNVNGGSVLAG